MRLVITDVDGVLTDGSIHIGQDGEIFKSFDVRDGQGIVDWIDSGNEFGIVTGRTSDSVKRRAEELGITEVHQGVSDKLDAVNDILDGRPYGLDKIAYIGDDISDLDVLSAVGMSCCPADAAPTVRDESDYVSSYAGGNGAVRDVLSTLRDTEERVVGVIPARYGSSRLPGKPLVELKGKPMIQHVHDRASNAETLDELIVATDDDRIIESVESVGGEAIHTDPDHPTGTDRVAQVASQIDYDIVVNIQADEPLIDHEVIDATVRALKHNEPSVATPVSVINKKSALGDENVVKVVRSRDGKALYFSRARIPSRGKPEETHKHIGLYAFEVDMLLDYIQMDSNLESLEDLEQLRLLENGYDIQTTVVEYDGLEVNVEEDVYEVERAMESDIR